MIKCPNCGHGNLDGTLFCDECIWDLTGVESVPDDPGAMAAAAPPAASAPSVDVALVGDAPMAEAPMAEMPMGDAPMGEMPMDAPMGDMPMAEAEAMPMEAVAEPVPMDEGLGLEAGLTDAPPLEGLAEAPLEAPPMEGELPPLEGDLGLAEPPPLEAFAEAPPMEGEAPPMEEPPMEEPPLEGLAEAPPAETPPAEEGAIGEVTPIGEAGMVSGVVPAEPVSQAMRPSQVRQSSIAPLAPGLPLAGGQPRLVVVRGVKTNVEYNLMEGTNFLGRFDELPVDIDLSDQEPSDKIWTSRQHACITWDGAGLTIEDLNSSNGTYINRNKIGGGEKKPLRNGDYIQVGAVLFQVKL